MICSPAARLWLEIVSAKGIGNASWAELRKSVTLEEITSMLASAEGRERLGRIFGRGVRPPDRRFAAAQLRRLERSGCGVLCISDDAYPPLLRAIADPPPVLFFAGNPDPLLSSMICVVGSRRATRRGLIAAHGIARGLSERGVHVVSGLARGIDGAAHEGALAGAGGTSAVLGCGVDLVYPPEHARLAARIRERGCIVSELPLGTPPFKYNFPLRNRILSGLSLGVVVVEAAERSGALGTATWAADQGREVFAVPGPVDSAMSGGPHKLIRDGARLAASAEQILEDLPSASSIRDASRAAAEAGPQLGLFAEDERRVLAALDLDPKHIDELVQFCHISPAIILPILLDLEMRGVIVSCGSGSYALAAPAG